MRPHLPALPDEARRPATVAAGVLALCVCSFGAGRDSMRQEGLALAALQSGYVGIAPTADHASAWGAGADPTPDDPAHGSVAPDWLPTPVLVWWVDVIAPAAQRHRVDPALAAIVVTVESGGNPLAQSGAGALGLYQVVPRFHPRLLEADPLDPHHNADVGTAYLADCLRRYGIRDDADWQRSVERAAACYNGGGGGVASPTAETRAYIRWVGGMWRERHDATSPTLEAWLAAGGHALVDDARHVLEAVGVLPPSAGGTMGATWRPRP